MSRSDEKQARTCPMYGDTAPEPLTRYDGVRQVLMAALRPAVEEALRMGADPGIGIPRHLTEGTEVGDSVLPAGATVLRGMGAAGRDESTYDAADEMGLDRQPDAHLAFGVGPHSCLGQAPARVELRTVLDVLLRRLPSLELAVAAEELRRLEGLAVGGLREVPVRW